MPILPIDLQTLFSQMNQVGKEQALQKEVPPIHQSLQGMEIAENAKVKDESINQTDQVGEGLEKIKDKEKKKEKENARRKKGKNKEENDSEDKEIITESYLGHHIDITG